MLLDTARQKKTAKSVLFFLFLFYIIGWVFIITTNQTVIGIDWWGDTYQIVAGFSSFFVGIIALQFYRFKNSLWKVYLFFSGALCAQFLGQMTVLFLLINNRDSQIFPSIADIFFFLSAIFYVVGSCLLYRKLYFVKTGDNNSIFLSMILYVALIAMYHLLFVSTIHEDMVYTTKVLSYTYAFVESVYITIIVTWVVKNIRNRGFRFLVNSELLGYKFLFVGLVTQFIADTFFPFLYLENTWLLRAFPDVLYLESFFFIGYGLLKLQAEDR